MLCLIEYIFILKKKRKRKKTICQRVRTKGRGGDIIIYTAFKISADIVNVYINYNIFQSNYL